MTEPGPIPRRDFARALALAAVAAPSALGDEPKKDDEPKKEAAKDQPKPEPPKPLDEVEARMAIILARYGKHAQLDEKARAAIRNEVAAIVRRGEALRKVPLGNGDGPFPVFHPYRAPLA
jgi:hypothetical protein